MNLTIKKGILVFIMVLSLSHCGNRKPIDIDEEVRDPSSHSESVIQIAPMVPEATQLLIAEAESQWQNNQPNEAILTLKRALSISPGSAMVQQHLAEIYLSDGAYQEAFEWSNQVVRLGPSHGPICERARRTLALAAEMLNDIRTQSEALEAIANCTQTREPKY